MAKKNSSIAALGEQAIEEVKRGRPVGSKNKKKKGPTKTASKKSNCDLSALRHASSIVAKAKIYIKEAESAPTARAKKK